MSATRKPLIISNLKILGVYQLLGGVFGLILIFINFFNSDIFSSSPIVLAILGFVILLYGYSTYCGIACIKDEPHALLFSKINQYLQLINLSGQNIAFTYVSGIAIFAGIDLTHSFGFTFNFSISSFLITFTQDSDDKIITLNLVALYLIFNFNVLIKQKRENEKLQSSL